MSLRPPAGMLSSAEDLPESDNRAEKSRNSVLSRLFVAHNQELLSFLMTRLSEAEAREVA